jgi:DNA-binding transcriptional ArsR family regulator
MTDAPARKSQSEARLVRLALHGLARRCRDEGRPFPKHRSIAHSFGRSAGQISRHLGWLQDRALVEFVQRGRSVYVRRVAEWSGREGTG